MIRFQLLSFVVFGLLITGCNSSPPAPAPVPSSTVAENSNDAASIPDVGTNQGNGESYEPPNEDLSNEGAESNEDASYDGAPSDPDALMANQNSGSGSEPADTELSPEMKANENSTTENADGTPTETSEYNGAYTEGEGSKKVEPEIILPKPDPVRDEAIAAIHEAGGKTKIDWTNEENPVEAAYFAGAMDAEPVNVTVKAVETLKLFPALKTLVIVRANIEPGTLELIDQLTTLETLVIGRTKFTDSDLPKLASLTNLKILLLCHTEVTEDAISAYRNGRDNIEITNWDTSFENQAVGRLKRLDAKIRYEGRTPNRIVVSIEMTGKEVTDESMRYVRGLVDLRELSVIDTWASADENVLGLAGLRTADFSGSYLDDNGLARLAGLPHLKEINLSQSKVTSTGIVNLRSMASLETLHVQSKIINDETVSALVPMTNLKTLDIAYNGITTPEAWKKIGELKALESLDVARSQFDQKSVAELAGLTNLTHLNLSEASLSQGGGPEILSRFTKLKSLDLSKSDIKDSDLEQLAALKDLEELILKECSSINGSGLIHLEGLSNLKKLDLNKVPIKDESLRYISKLETLETLDINESAITDDGLVHLKDLKKLKTLALKKCNITFQGFNRLKRSLRRTKFE